MILIHGEDQVASRAKLVDLTKLAEQQHLVVTHLPITNLTLAQLESLLVDQDLFGQRQSLVIEELLSARPSNLKKKLLNLLANQTGPICLWEGKTVPAGTLKKFNFKQIYHFPLDQKLFKWLDALTPTTDLDKLLPLTKEVLSLNSAPSCLAMLARQVRMMILAKENQLTGPAFIQKKISSQAKKFSLAKLLTLHHQLLIIEQQQKTSSSWWPLSTAIEQLVINLAQP